MERVGVRLLTKAGPRCSRKAAAGSMGIDVLIIKKKTYS
tara:strand:+ start:7980 stop:8096 length:117 start_codon:yes stop_codon:yes gene_type:complete